MAHLSNHPAPCLVPLPTGCPLLLLLQDTLSAGMVLQGKLPQKPAEACNPHVLCRVCVVAQEQEKGVEP